MKRKHAVLTAQLLYQLIKYLEVSKILSTFLPAFLNKSILKSDGVNYLHGNFNLNGTVSGRLSSSKVNLQNLPSTGTSYAKLIKECFQAPPGWILCGADFSSLEDKISALTTRDPNKLKVYCDGYDGHCLRAYAYFKDKLPGIINTVASINSIADLFPMVRQNSKLPTFALTYGGTWIAIRDQAGLSDTESKAIEDNYHKLYSHSDEWVQDRLIQASKDGFITVAFGLRIRTPILAQTLLNKKSTPFEAQAEARTAGNAMGQSYGLLNNRAAIEFQQRVLASKWALLIKPIAHIHDAQYFIIKDNIHLVKWVNDNLIACMQWQDTPELRHAKVKLGGDLSLFYPHWAKEAKIPNGSSVEQIRQICKKHKESL